MSHNRFPCSTIDFHVPQSISMSHNQFPCLTIDFHVQQSISMSHDQFPCPRKEVESHCDRDFKRRYRYSDTKTKVVLRLRKDILLLQALRFDIDCEFISSDLNLMRYLRFKLKVRMVLFFCFGQRWNWNAWRLGKTDLSCIFTAVFPRMNSLPKRTSTAAS